MASLKVSDAGLQLEGSEGAGPTLPTQIFPVTISNDAIQGMIDSVRNGDGVQLTLGKNPTFHYGSRHFTPSPTDSPPVDIYLTKPFESTKTAVRIPQTSPLFEKPGPQSRNQNGASRPRKLTSSSLSSGPLDSEIETLQSSIAAMEASKNHSRILESVPKTNKKGAGRVNIKSKHLSTMASYGGKSGSSPSSPSMATIGSPSLNQGYGVSQQTMEKAKGQRFLIVHELAASEQPSAALEAKWDGNAGDFKTTLEKVADFNAESQKWSLKKLYWRELDVWNYDYESQDDRQRAIDNAIKVFDRMRKSTEEPEWERLLAKEDRGKGIILSKLQAGLANGPAARAPKITLQKVGEAAGEGGDENGLKADRDEAASRSSSQPVPAKKKVTNATAAQTKRLLSGKSKAGAAANASLSTPKTSPSKSSKERGSGAKGGRILSAEFITNSDSDSESSESKPMAVSAKQKKSEVTPPPSAPQPTKAKPKPKPTATASTKSKPPTRPAERPEPTKQTVPAKKEQMAKRQRDEDDEDSTSSSGAPLAKRLKPKMALSKDKTPSLQAPASVKQRSTAPEPKRPATNGNYSSQKTAKNTSPAKSSPLASSPPTNASDFEHRRVPPPEPVIAVNRKRKSPMDTSDDGTTSSDSNKRHRPMTQDLVRKAQRFKAYYEKYVNLHRQVSSLDHPPKQKLEDLLDMHRRLQDMKVEIYSECSTAIAA